MKYSILLALAFLFASCSGVEYSPAPDGDKAEIIMKDNREVTAELLFVTDSSIFYLRDNHYIEEVHLKKIQDVKVLGYNNDSWAGPVVLSSLIPVSASIYAIAAGGAAIAVAVPLLVMTVAEFVLFAVSSSEKPGLTGKEINKVSLSGLKKYTRFPQGLTDEQFKEFSKDKSVKK